MQSERTTFEALNSALRFAASRSAITSVEELAIMAAWNARASDAEITRLTKALRDAEEREKGLVRLVERAQVNTPDQYVNWHEHARQALAGAKP